LHEEAQQTLNLFPGDPTAANYLNRGLTAATPSTPQPAPATPKTADDFLNLSLAYERAGRHQECIEAAQQALKLRPDFPEAYNNIAAGYQSMYRWDEAIAAAQQALKLRPDFQLARNNLAWSQSQKQLQDAAKKK